MREQLIMNIGFNSLLKICLFSVSIMSLGACAVHKASFDCANGQGMGCGSMIDVHKSIQDKSFEQVVSTDFSSSRKAITTCKSCQKSNPVNKNNTGDISLDSNIFYSADKVSRSKDKVMRVWFNSYFDEYNNFHDSQYIYTVIQPSQWLVKSEEVL